MNLADGVRLFDGGSSIGLGPGISDSILNRPAEAGLCPPARFDPNQFLVVEAGEVRSVDEGSVRAVRNAVTPFLRMREKALDSTERLNARRDPSPKSAAQDDSPEG
jgi:hypothetical protein